LGDKEATNIFMTFNGKVGKPGKYSVSLIVNGVEHYSTTLHLLPMNFQSPVGTVQ